MVLYILSKIKQQNQEGIYIQTYTYIGAVMSHKKMKV